MKITVIEAGRPPSPLDRKFGDYPEMFRRLLNADAEHFEIHSIAAHEGEPLPDPHALEAILITGSPAGVYDDLPWIAPMADFTRKAYAAGVTIVGICFGHQMLAHALGGDVRKSDKGWGVGRREYDLLDSPPFMPGAPARVAMPASHQDQVLVPPKEARVIAASDFTPYAGLLYRNGRAVSLQPHPEFSPAFAAALYDLRHRTWLGDEVVDQAIVSLNEPSDNALVGRYLARFLRGLSG